MGTGLGFAAGSGGVKFGVLFDVTGKILKLHLTSNGQGGRGDELWDKVEMVLGLGQLLKGLIIAVTKYGLKTLAKRRAAKMVDDLFESLEDSVPKTTPRTRETIPYPPPPRGVGGSVGR
jgi:hypothetical protein